MWGGALIHTCSWCEVYLNKCNVAFNIDIIYNILCIIRTYYGTYIHVRLQSCFILITVLNNIIAENTHGKKNRTSGKTIYMS